MRQSFAALVLLTPMLSRGNIPLAPPFGKADVDTIPDEMRGEYDFKEARVNCGS